jgi:hypothetical protein
MTTPRPRPPQATRLELVALVTLLIAAGVLDLVLGPGGLSAVATTVGGLFVAWRTHH